MKPVEVETSPNLVYGVALFIGVSLACWFFAMLLDSKSGEIAGALGNVIGGMLGASAAVLAVHLTISRQRREEASKVNDAVRTEVTAFAKYVIGAIKICKQIANGTIKVPRQDARYIANKFWGAPVIYPAVADRVGLLRHPHATTEFYMRLSEAKAMIESLLAKTEIVSATVVTAPQTLYVTKENAEVIADSLITALQLARAVIVDEGGPSEATWLKTMIQNTVVRQVDDCMASAKLSFPNAESFQLPPDAERSA